MIIYKITNNINNKVYIGQTIGSVAKRWSYHCGKDSRCRVMANAIRKYGRESFKIEIIDKSDNIDNLNKKEQFWIESLQSISPNGYNLQSGGLNHLASEETRKLQSESAKGNTNAKGKKRSMESRRKISESLRGQKGRNTGNKHSIEVRRKISEAGKGRQVSEKTRRKMSEAHIGKIQSNSRSVLCLTNNTIYPSISHAAKKLNIAASNIHGVLSGVRKLTKGYIFKYVERIM